MDTLLKYNLGADVTAFSTTRISPQPISAEEIKAMGNYAMLPIIVAIIHNVWQKTKHGFATS